MKILIIEDDDLKHQHLDKFIKEFVPNSFIEWRKSYHAGHKELIENNYDLILLDMSMHIYEKTAHEHGGSFEKYAGRMLLSEIDINDIDTKVIVITGYDVYSDGKTLETLKTELRDEFGDFYIDTIYFIGSDEKWKSELKELINREFNNE